MLPVAIWNWNEFVVNWPTISFRQMYQKIVLVEAYEIHNLDNWIYCEKKSGNSVSMKDESLSFKNEIFLLTHT